MRKLFEFLLFILTLIWLAKLGFEYLDNEVQELATHDVICTAYLFTKSNHEKFIFYTTEEEMRDLSSVKAKDGTIFNLLAFPAYKCKDVNPNNNSDNKLEYITYDYTYLDALKKESDEKNKEENSNK